MSEIKVVSFDAEGTLVTPRFSQAVWYEAIPMRYAGAKGMSFEQAKESVQQQYHEVGDQRLEWYDIKYWFGRFALGDHQEVLNSYKHEIRYYPEVEEVLSLLGKSYELIVVSNSAREFLELLLGDIERHFVGIFSSISDYGELKTADFYLNVCRAMQIEPSEMVHVGDSWDFDFVIPKVCGIETFYLDRGGRSDGCEVVRDLKQFWEKLLSL